MVQCAEGHLFCFACLKRRVEESTFGAAAAGGSLPCMDTDGCEAEFPYAEVRDTYIWHIDCKRSPTWGTTASSWEVSR